MANKILRVMYISESILAPDSNKLMQMCSQFATNNAKDNITGLLMRVGNFFVQILEGENHLVLTLVEKIIKDTRHKNFRILDQRLVDERLFNDWSMNLLDLDCEYSLKLKEVRELREHIQTLSEVGQELDDKRELTMKLILTVPSLLKESES